MFNSFDFASTEDSVSGEPQHRVLGEIMGNVVGGSTDKSIKWSDKQPVSMPL